MEIVPLTQEEIRLLKDGLQLLVYAARCEDSALRAVRNLKAKLETHWHPPLRGPQGKLKYNPTVWEEDWNSTEWQSYEFPQRLVHPAAKRWSP